MSILMSMRGCARKISQIKRPRQSEKRGKRTSEQGGLGGHAYETFTFGALVRAGSGSFRNDYNDFHSKHLPIAYACSCGSS